MHHSQLYLRLYSLPIQFNIECRDNNKDQIKTTAKKSYEVAFFKKLK